MILALLSVQAADNAFNVGDYAGEFVSNLITASGAAHDDIHIVGFRQVVISELLLGQSSAVIMKALVYLHIGIINTFRSLHYFKV